MNIKVNKAVYLVLALMLILMPVLSVSAVDITIEGTAKEYKAYKLLNLTVSLKTTEHPAECNGTTHVDGCYNYSYTVNTKYGTLLKEVATTADTDSDGTVSDKELLIYIQNLDSVNMRTFADSVYKKIVTQSLEADYTSSTQTVSVTDQGYYLITESQNADDPDSTSLVMVDTAGAEDITITSKEDVPSLSKKILENSPTTDAAGNLTNLGTTTDAVDEQVGKDVTFALTGDMPENIGNYTTYMYVFHDVMSSGLSLKADTIKVYIDNKLIDASKYTVQQSPTDTCTFEVSFTDIKQAATITKDSKVVVTYMATITADAVSGNPGNSNDSHLEFSNDPYVSSSTSTTPDDKVKVFQFTVLINKTDKDKQPVAGAEFKLYKDNRTAGADEAVWEEEVTATKNADGTSFTFKGIAQGTYKLVETTVPDGYNKADDVVFELVAVYDTDSEDPKITSFQVKQGGVVVSEGDNATFLIDASLGTTTASVVNTTGIKLPSTGEFERAMLLYVGIGAVVFGLAFFTVARFLKDEKKN